MTDVTLRPATRADIAAVDALLARSYPVLLKPDYPPSVLVTVLPLISRAQPELVTCGTYYVAEAEGEIRAAGGWTAQSPVGGARSPGLCHIRHVVTDHRQTRRGYGRALMTHVFATARAAGYVRIEAISTLTAVPFYRAMGLEPLRAISVPIGPAGVGFPAVQMQRDL